MSIRYLVRQAAIDGQWMVWDRFQKRPARVGDRILSGLSLSEAKQELKQLEEASDDTPERSRAHWQLVKAGAILIDCKNEEDARLRAKELDKTGTQLKVQVSQKGEVIGSIEGSLLKQWLRDD